MTPDQLKQMALEATKKEYDSIILTMQEAAAKGSFTCRFQTITDGAVHQLKEAGYDVRERSEFGGGPYPSKKKFFEVRFSK